MGMGSLATIGLQKPANLSIVVLDNEAYGETGGQTSHTASAADLVGVAKACGIADSRAISTMAEVRGLRDSDPGHLGRSALCQCEDRCRQSRADVADPGRYVYTQRGSAATSDCADLEARRAAHQRGAEAEKIVQDQRA